MSLTQDEVELLGDLVAARDAETGAEMWSLIDEPDYLVEAHRLVERGWITRRVDGNEIWWRLTDEGLAAVHMAAAAARVNRRPGRPA